MVYTATSSREGRGLLHARGASWKRALPAIQFPRLAPTSLFFTLC